ncbi:hypothetical protein [Saccharothrix deserti]|uniref:hypothetical protein n=1 Tax=Saccharothrix deserti TaxID=2593674 RepID=UPI00131CA5BD|nr:hypothetical protein [Saccharothrix deserti]
MATGLVGWVERRALRGSGRLAAFAAGYLYRRSRYRASPYVESLVRVMCQAPDERVAGRARSALEQAWHNQPLSRERIWNGIRNVVRAEAERNRRNGRDLPWVVILALLDVRPDLVHHYNQQELAQKLLGTLAGPEPLHVVDACRRILRGLPSGAGRELVCEQAIAGDAEALAAAVDAEYVPVEPTRVPLFLFCTEQWDRYDRLDPAGRELRKHRHGYTDADWHRLDEVADRTGRACPTPPRPRPPATSQPSTSARTTGGTGTSGSGGFSTGGFTVHGV